MYDELNRVIAALHAVDPAAVGLADYGRHGEYIVRQVNRWSRQYQASRTENIDAMDRLIAWLPEHVPADDETRIVHGDFRLDNVIFHPSEPQIVAVLDWELSTLGHPLSDFAYHCMVWRVEPDVFRGLAGHDLAALGVPTEAEHVAAYCRRTGRAGIAARDWEYYMAFNMFRHCRDHAGYHGPGAVGHGGEQRSAQDGSPRTAARRARVAPGGTSGNLRARMEFAYSARRSSALQTRLLAFMEAHVYPGEARFAAEVRRTGARETSGFRRDVMEELKAHARADGLWNLWLPESEYGAGLTNLEYAPLCEIMGRSRDRPRSIQLLRARYRQHGGAGPLRHRGSEARWLEPLLEGEDPLGVRDDGARRSRRRMRPTSSRASSADGDEYVHQRPQVVDLGRRRPALHGS